MVFYILCIERLDQLQPVGPSQCGLVYAYRKNDPYLRTYMRSAWF